MISAFLFYSLLLIDVFYEPSEELLLNILASHSCTCGNSTQLWLY